MKLYNQAELSTLKLSDIADLYNRYASITGDKPVTKFRDKPTAVKRTLEIQAIAAPTAEEPVANPAKKSAKKETKDEPRNFKLSDLRPKENTAFHTLISLIGTGGISEKDLIEGFIENYSFQYKGDKEVDISFAKGYVSGALRGGYIVQV